MPSTARLPVDTRPRALMAWLLGYALRRWGGLLATLAALLCGIGVDLLAPWPMKLIVDHVLSGHPMSPQLATIVSWLPRAATPDGLLVWCVIATVGLFLLRWALSVVSAYARIGFGQRMVYDLAGDLFSHLQRLSLRVHSRQSIGDTIRRVTVDSTCVSAIVNDAVLPLLTASVALVTMFVVMWQLDATLTLLSLMVVPVMAVVLARYLQPMLESSYRQQDLEGQLYSVVDETLQAMPVVQAYGDEPRAEARYRATAAASIDASMVETRIQLGFQTWIAGATAIGTAAILWVGASHVLAGTLSVGSILVFLAYLGSFYAPLHAMMYSSSTTQGAAGSARRVLELLGTDREVKDRPGATALSAVRGHIEFQGVSAGYEQGRPVLHEVSFEARPGDVIALVGPTGAGKSTLVSLLPRFLDPSAGRILVDGCDVRDVTLLSLRQQMAIVLQEPFLFPLTIAENIAYGRPEASRGEIEEAARAANAHAFIERLPDGYDTLVGERGATVSGGERQRLSIARALLKNAPILILDEPTSAVDVETEALLLDALGRLMRGRTTFIIAHRLSTIRQASRVLVVQAGSIVETGTHTELLAHDGLYARLHRLQAGSSSAAAGGR